METSMKLNFNLFMFMRHFFIHEIRVFSHHLNYLKHVSHTIRIVYSTNIVQNIGIYSSFQGISCIK